MIRAYIDPGKHFCATSVFAPHTINGNGILIHVDFWREPGKVRPERWPQQFRQCRKVTVELPHVRYGNEKGKPDDLIAIAFRGGWLAGIVYPVSDLAWVKPSDWKRTVDPDILLERIESRLDPGEKLILRLAKNQCPEGLHHNLIDSVGMGLHEAGRLWL